MGGEITLDFTPDQLRRIHEDATKTGISVAALRPSQPMHAKPINSPGPRSVQGIDVLREGHRIRQAP